MNFLAHAYLSGDDEKLLIGNFIADAVKGNDYQRFDSGIQRGIILHRFIDEYTDSHEIVKESKARVREACGKYAGVVIDIFYDHFLAVNWALYHPADLKLYTSNIYHLLDQYLDILPPRVQQFFPYMVKQNWLYNYSNEKGILRVLQGMSRRTHFDSGMEDAMVNFKKDYAEFGKEFNSFFPDLVREVSGRIHL